MGVAHLDYEDCAHVGVGFSLLHVSTDIHDLEVEVGRLASSHFHLYLCRCVMWTRCREASRGSTD